MGGKPGVSVGGDNPRGGVHVDPVRPPRPEPPRMAGVGALPPSPSSPTPVPPNQDTPVDLPRVGPDRERAAMNYDQTRAQVARERAEFLRNYKKPESPKKDCPPGCSPT